MLTNREALQVAEKLDIWPGGMGYALEPSTKSKRGYRAAHDPKTGKTWRPFYYPPPPGALL